MSPLSDQLTKRFKGLTGRFERSAGEYVWRLPMAVMPLLAIVYIGIKSFLDPAYFHAESPWVWAAVLLVLVFFAWVFFSCTFRSYEISDGVLTCRIFGEVRWQRPVATIESVVDVSSIWFNIIQVDWPDWSERLFVSDRMRDALRTRGSDT